MSWAEGRNFGGVTARKLIVMEGHFPSSGYGGVDSRPQAAWPVTWVHQGAAYQLTRLLIRVSLFWRNFSLFLHFAFSLSCFLLLFFSSSCLL